MTRMYPLRSERRRLLAKLPALHRERGIARDGLKQSRWHRRMGAYACGMVLVLSLGFAVPALGQSPLIDAAQTPPQEASAESILRTQTTGLCPDLIASYNNGEIQTGSAREDLLVRCREVVAESRRPDGTLDSVRNGLQSMAPEEVSAQGTNIMETSNMQFSNITARLAALRGGATNVSLRPYALQLEQPDLPFTLVASTAPVALSAAREPEETAAPFSKFGLFANGTYSFGDKDATLRESGFDFHTFWVTAGGDYRLNRNVILGVALGYQATDVDLDLDGGASDVNGYSISVYGTYLVTDRFYIDSIVSVGWQDYDIERSIRYSVPGLNPDGSPTGSTTVVDQTARGDSDAVWYAFSVGAGYDFNVGSFTLGPFARLNYLKADIDGYREETDNTAAGYGLLLDVGSQDVVSLATVLGGEATYALSTPWGVLLPQLRLEWEHEFENDSRTIYASFVEDPTPNSEWQMQLQTDDPDRDFFRLGLGLSGTFRGGVSGFVQYETVFGLADVAAHNIALGVRVEL